MGLQLPASFDASFAALKNRDIIKAEITRNTAAHCDCATVFEGPSQPFIAEGIAFDPRSGLFLVSSVYQRKIVAIADGRMRDFTAVLPDGLSPFSITLDTKRNHIWVSAASLAQSHGATDAQRGHSALLAFDIRSGTVITNIAAPSGTDLGDTTLATDGTVYASDSKGDVYRLKPGSTKLEAIAKGLSSAQGIAISHDGRTALIADYALGLMRLNLSTGKLAPVGVPDTVTTLGIDGLTALPDGGFAATQNGIAPARIVRFRLSPDWSRVTGFDVIAQNAPSISDPSLLAAAGKSIYAVGVSQWDSFDEEKGDPVRAVPSFGIVRIDLP
jgi:streptogramin lyase